MNPSIKDRKAKFNSDILLLLDIADGQSYVLSNKRRLYWNLLSPMIDKSWN